MWINFFSKLILLIGCTLPIEKFILKKPSKLICEGTNKLYPIMALAFNLILRSKTTLLLLLFKFVVFL